MPPSRRRFLRNAASAGLALPAFAQTGLSPNDRVQIATIGIGGMGFGDTRNALKDPGVELVAVCDLYTGRLERAKELFGDGIATTRDYREILARPDVDAVIIATPDHWHVPIAKEALKAKKDVYLQKPMVHKISEGKGLIEEVQRGKQILQVGSQYVTSSIYKKAREIIQSGQIGQLTMVEAWLDRNTATGAWQYTVPPDAGPETVDWDRFLGSAPKRPFDATRFFRWRNYNDYGTGLAGDLYVHLLSGLHFATNSKGPSSVYSTGGLRYWKDGRDVPDVMLALFDYPESPEHPAFNLALRVNFKSGVPDERFGFRFCGTEGSFTTSYDTLEMVRTPDESAPGYTIGTFTKATQEAFLKDYNEKYPEMVRQNRGRVVENSEYKASEGYSAHVAHHEAFMSAVRTRKPVVEDAVFGFRAAGPALLCNESYYKKSILYWDPAEMQQART
ncbi:MAG: Gfo/Idh/MocA family oxidoreductase [Bryobacterales bacterium]|nr:Gfo/Idh/MocA family oxidoreductase [Bryobacterales bacterium]